MGVHASSVEFAPCFCERSLASTRANDVEDKAEVSADVSDDPPIFPDQAFALRLGTELLEATGRNDVEIVRSLLSQRACADFQDPQSGRMPLHIAASAGCLTLVPILLQSGAISNRKDCAGRTPFLVAVECRQCECATVLAKELKAKERQALGKSLIDFCARGRFEESKILLECSASADARDREGKSALHFVAAAGHVPLARLLLDRGARRDAKSKTNSTPLEEAARAGQLRLVAWLVDKGAKLRKCERDALSDHLLSAAEAGKLDVVKSLLMYDAKLNTRRKDGSTALILAAKNGHWAIGEFLVQIGKQKAMGRCPSDDRKLGNMLLDACGQGDLMSVQMLLRCGALVSCTNCHNDTPVWKAAFGGHKEIAELLISERADLEVRSQECGRTPLVIAIDKGRAEVAELLLARKAETPEPSILCRKLLQAANNGEVARLRLLLRARADVLSTEACREEASRRNVILAVSRRGAGGKEVEATPPSQSTETSRETALHRAVAGGQLECAKLLLAADANVDAKAGKPARTALAVAVANSNTEIVHLLLGSGANRQGRDKEGFRMAQEFLTTSKF